MLYIDMKPIEAEADSLKKRIATLEEELNSLPKGRLYACKRKNGGVYYRCGTWDENGVHQVEYLHKNDKERIKKLAERLYLEKLLPILKKEQKALNSFIRGYCPEDKENVWYNLSPELRKLVLPVYQSSDELHQFWCDEEYEKK